jgi:hypothetical protein
VLNTGIILHLAEGQDGWAHARLPGLELAYMPAEPWEVLLKLVSLVWNTLWKGPYSVPDLSPYYADQEYFAHDELPRVSAVSNAQYVAQTQERFMVAVPSPRKQTDAEC